MVGEVLHILVDLVQIRCAAEYPGVVSEEGARREEGGRTLVQCAQNVGKCIAIDHDTGQVGIVLHEFGRHMDGYRSEEHTSELQSLMRISYAVFCLKKTTKNKARKT